MESLDEENYGEVTSQTRCIIDPSPFSNIT